MSSPAVDVFSVSTLFTIGSPSKSGQIEAGLVAGLYLVPWLSLFLQLPVCKGKLHAVLSTCSFAAGMVSLRKDCYLDAWSCCTPDRLDFTSQVCQCCAARGVGYIFRVLVEKQVTKASFEAYLILSSAATFLFIGALGNLIGHW